MAATWSTILESRIEVRQRVTQWVVSLAQFSNILYRENLLFLDIHGWHGIAETFLVKSAFEKFQKLNEKYTELDSNVLDLNYSRIIADGNVANELYHIRTEKNSSQEKYVENF